MATTSSTMRRAGLCGVLLALTLLLSACGFHLRGQGSQYLLPFPTLYVGLPDSSPLAIDLKRTVRAYGGTTIVATPQEADGVIEVLSNPEKTRSKSILSLNANGRVAQYMLAYAIVFQVRDKQGKLLLGPTPITLNRALDFNETQLLAKEQEEALLYKDMQSDLVQQMMRRMAAIKPVAAMSLAPDVPAQAPAPVPQR
ncbi:MAG: LPS assembly lipoprotein LptE [Pseudomonadota bacterium]